MLYILSVYAFYDQKNIFSISLKAHFMAKLT